MSRLLLHLMRWWDRQTWPVEAITVYVFALLAGMFAALLCQATMWGGAAVIALLVTAAWFVR